MTSGLRRTFFGLALLSSTAVVGCGDPSDGVESGARADRPDARLEVHAIEPGTPTKAGLEYLESVADAHAGADRAIEGGSEASARTRLRQALEMQPDDVPEAEVLRLDLAARLAQLELDRGEPGEARKALEPLLTPTSRSLPLDPVTARALVTLGDAARAEGDDALAAGSYARALKIMSMESAELGEDIR